MTASGCVWSTCAAGTNACSSVSIDGRGWSGRERAAEEVVDHLRVVHRRRARAAAAARRAAAPAKPAAVIVARSVPEPFTQSTRVSRPAWSSDGALGRRVAAAAGWRARGRRRAGWSGRRAPSSDRQARGRGSVPAVPGAGIPRSAVGQRCSRAHLQRRVARRQSRESLARLLPTRRSATARRRVGSNDARTTSRASASEAISPSAIACTRRLPSSVASSGPASTGRPVALGRPAAEQLVARAAADDVDLGRMPSR